MESTHTLSIADAESDIAKPTRTTREGNTVLDGVEDLINSGRVFEGLERMSHGLDQLRRQSPAHEWHQFAKIDCLNHPVRQLIHQDPFTLHSFQKPRGYSGDAGLIDLIYGITPVEPTYLGAQIYMWAIHCHACTSVRERRTRMASLIDDTATRVDRPNILSMACGHLREADLSDAVKTGSIGNLYAIDQDGQSLEIVRQNHAGSTVQPIHGSVRSIIGGKVRFNDLDLVYAAGLYDYLPLPVAQRLTTKMFAMLRPGGQLVVANFLPSLRDIGNMESFMNWDLIYRDEAELHKAADEIPSATISELNLSRDKSDNVVYLSLKKN